MLKGGHSPGRVTLCICQAPEEGEDTFIHDKSMDAPTLMAGAAREVSLAFEKARCNDSHYGGRPFEATSVYNVTCIGFQVLLAANKLHMSQTSGAAHCAGRSRPRSGTC